MDRNVYPIVGREFLENYLNNRRVIVADSGCWEFTGTLDPCGYGRIKLKLLGKSTSSHALSYKLYVGPIEAGLEIDHLCNNRKCFNPAHLEAVTHAENVKRALLGRRAVACWRGHEFTPENTRVWVSAKGVAGRYCVACNKIRVSEYNQRKKVKQDNRVNSVIDCRPAPL